MSEISHLISQNSQLNKEFIQNLIQIGMAESIQKIVVGAVIINTQNQILVLKRAKGDFMEDLVELPSGGADSDNLLGELAREIREETGIEDIKIQAYLKHFDYISGSGKKARQFNFLARVENPQITLNPIEHNDFYWLEIDELNDYNISEKSKEILRLAFAYRQSLDDE